MCRRGSARVDVDNKVNQKRQQNGQTAQPAVIDRLSTKARRSRGRHAGQGAHQACSGLPAAVSRRRTFCTAASPDPGTRTTPHGTARDEHFMSSGKVMEETVATFDQHRAPGPRKVVRATDTPEWAERARHQPHRITSPYHHTSPAQPTTC